MNLPRTALKAAQGIDTEDFLNHIAWDEIILPNLLSNREILTRQLVDSVLAPSSQVVESKEQIAGKIQGIDHVIKLVLTLVKEGREARKDLNQRNINLA